MSRTDHVTKVASRLEEAILSGELAPGDYLPSEREISAQMDVSRSVVREALGRLASLGLVRSVHGSGTRVEEPSSRPVTVGYQRLLRRTDLRIQDLAAVRLPLETTIAALAAARRTAADLDALRATQKVLGNPRRSLEAHVRADLDFHAVLARATGNPLFQVVLAPIQELLIESRRQTLGRYGAEIAFRHHARILTAVEASDADAAERAMREHIQANFQHLNDVAGE
jgi:GntR family transcriptional regulator, transcriptional repressor for pyruvate dehydrogenase complex